ncbi:unnamed protein product [Vicia faba]|uniref:Uncharacterized protein n=1 Tax=Vicia faba TaxID=3906 RepID=A0AAV0ZYG5_VICFA|nr:unnamed protein product [Vicia faba]
MRKSIGWCLVFICLLIPIVIADWNILKLSRNGLEISLKNYCESWRMNVELHNISDFEVVPGECIEYIGKYMKSTQYKVDSERATQECLVHNDGYHIWGILGDQYNSIEGIPSPIRAFKLPNPMYYVS